MGKLRPSPSDAQTLIENAKCRSGLLSSKICHPCFSPWWRARNPTAMSTTKWTWRPLCERQGSRAWSPRKQTPATEQCLESSCRGFCVSESNIQFWRYCQYRLSTGSVSLFGDYNMRGYMSGWWGVWWVSVGVNFSLNCKVIGTAECCDNVWLRQSLTYKVS